MENAYKKYLKKGLTAEQSLVNMEMEYMLILKDIGENHPELIRNTESKMRIQDWVRSISKTEGETHGE